MVGTLRSLRGSRAWSATVGLAILIVLVLLVAFALNASQGVPFQAHAEARIAFSNVQGLVVSDDVRIADTRVGEVENIAVKNGQAVVTVRFDQPRTLYRNARATIAERSGMGEQYVNIDPGTRSGGVLAASDVLPRSRTQPASQVLDLLQQLNAPTRQALASMLQQVGGGAAGHGQDLGDFAARSPAMVGDVGTLSKALDSGNGKNLVEMLGSLNNLAGQFHGHEQQLQQLVSRLNTTMTALGVDRGTPLEQTLSTAPPALRHARSALADLQQPLETTGDAAAKLAPGASALARSTPDLRAVLEQGPAPLGKVPGVSRLGQPAVSDATTVMRYAQPVAPQAVRAVNTAYVPLNVLSPYAPEIAMWFSYATDALHQGGPDGHWLRFTLIPTPDSVAGSTPVRDPLSNSAPDPAPGQSGKQHGSPLLAPLGISLNGGHS